MEQNIILMVRVGRYNLCTVASPRCALPRPGEEWSPTRSPESKLCVLKETWQGWQNWIGQAHTLAPITLWPLQHTAYMIGLPKWSYLEIKIHLDLNKDLASPPTTFNEVSAQIYRLPLFMLLYSATFPAYLSWVKPTIAAGREPLLLISAHIPAVWKCVWLWQYTPVAAGSEWLWAICAISALASRQCSLKRSWCQILPLNLSGIRCIRVYMLSVNKIRSVKVSSQNEDTL